jgi:enamine deaminase RidA (YjgF/YER057c/UK114 family)
VARRSIQIPGVEHAGQPFPMASRVGPFVATSGIHGVEPATGELAEGAEAQVRQAFANLRAVLAEAGASPDDVAQVLVTLTDRAHRALVNPHWVELFPDPASRPARQTAERELPGGSLCMLIAYAWVE